MSQIFKAILAGLAITAGFGAVQLASGHDLTGLRQLAATAPAADINRAAKADRVVLRAAQARPRRSRSAASASTTRPWWCVFPWPGARRPGARGPGGGTEPPASPARPGGSKMTVACEPPVSVLTEVAKLLQPGRCVT
jgi:hypothetical protein